MRRRWRAYRRGHQPGPYAMHSSYGDHRGITYGPADRRSRPPTEHDRNYITTDSGMAWVYLVEEIPDGEE